MNRTNYRVSLNIKEIYSPFTISMKRGDTSGRLLITLMSGGKPFQIPEGCYATFESTRPDNVIIHEGCIVQNNTIVFDMGKGVTAVAGKLPCEITLYDLDGTVLVSPQFAIMVYDTVFSQETVESSNEYTSLTTLISDANALINEVERKLKNGEFIGEQGVQGEQGEKGDKGDKGDNGTNGADGEDGVSVTHTWNGTVLTINSASGTSSADLKGEKGEKGDDGKSIAILGSLSSEIQLPLFGESGQGYLIDGYLYVWDSINSKWINVGKIKGEKGEKGDKGDPGVDGVTHPVEFVTEKKYNELKASGGLVDNCVYYITDDTTLDKINSELELINQKLNGLDGEDKRYHHIVRVSFNEMNDPTKRRTLAKLSILNNTSEVFTYNSLSNYLKKYGLDGYPVSGFTMDDQGRFLPLLSVFVGDGNFGYNGAIYITYTDCITSSTSDYSYIVGNQHKSVSGSYNLNVTDLVEEI